MLILILIDVQYSQKAVFSFGKGSNCQNQSSSGSLHAVKKSSHPHPSKISISLPPTPPLTATWKTLHNKAVSLSLVKCLIGFEPGTF